MINKIFLHLSFFILFVGWLVFVACKVYWFLVTSLLKEHLMMVCFSRTKTVTTRETSFGKQILTL